MSPETRYLLIDVRSLLENPANWTRREWARDVNGRGVEPEAPTAVCWCLEGAIVRAAKGTFGPVTDEAYRALRAAAGSPPAVFNDWHDHSAVLGLIDQVLGAEATP